MKEERKGEEEKISEWEDRGEDKGREWKKWFSRRQARRKRGRWQLDEETKRKRVKEKYEEEKEGKECKIVGSGKEEEIEENEKKKEEDKKMPWKNVRFNVYSKDERKIIR